MTCPIPVGTEWDRQAVTAANARTAALSEGDWVTETLRHVAVLRNLLADEQLPDGRLVDVGCGPGRLTYPMAGATRRNVVGVDVSRRMIDHAIDDIHTGEHLWLAKGRVAFHHIEQPDCPPCAAAFSMLVFQHVPLETVAAWLYTVRQAVADGGRFVFQFVEGDYHHGLDHRHRIDTIDAAATLAGWDVVHTQTDSTFPEWKWMVCQA